MKTASLCRNTTYLLVFSILFLLSPTSTFAKTVTYIKEYTYIPDFVKLGYSLMALTLIKRAEGSKEESSLFKEANKYAVKMGFDTVMAVRGMGFGYDAAIISFHENYSAFLERIREVKQFPGIDVEDVESFIVDLTDKELYRQLTFSTLANHMLTLGKTQE